MGILKVSSSVGSAGFGNITQNPEFSLCSSSSKTPPWGPGRLDEIGYLTPDYGLSPLLDTQGPYQAFLSKAESTGTELLAPLSHQTHPVPAQHPGAPTPGRTCLLSRASIRAVVELLGTLQQPA